MFGNIMKRNQPPVQGKLAVVEIFNALVRDHAEARAKEGTLLRGLEQAESRLAAIPGEEQAVHDNHYRNIVQREVDPARPDLTEQHNRMLADLVTERAQMSGKVSAYGQELQAIQRTLAKLAGEHGQIERARRAMWSTIAESLAAQVSPDFQKQFLRLWSALDRVSNGIHAVGVLPKLVSIELPTESKMATLNELCHEFGIAND